MDDFSAVIEAIDRLTIAVNQSSGSFAAECMSTFLATLGSVAAVVIFEFIKDGFFSKRSEFKRLRRKVSSTLYMYAPYYSNPIDRESSKAKVVERYDNASDSVRELAVELMAFANEIKIKISCPVPVSDILNAASLLIGLSNSFFTPYHFPERSESKENREMCKEIKRLLKIR